MYTWRWLAMVVGVWAWTAEGQAHPPLLPGPVGVVGNGVGFHYHRRHLSVSGFWGRFFPASPYVVPAGTWVPSAYCPPYGVSTNRVTVQIIAPNILLPSPVPRISPYEYDLSGVDLDVEPPPPPLTPPLKGGARGGARPVPAPAPAPPEKPMPGVDVSAPRKVVRPGDVPEKKRVPEPAPKPPAAKIVEPPPPPPPPKAAPAKDDQRDDWQRFVEFGLTAMGKGEYGVGVWRFRQAVAAEPARAKAHFLLAQALFALGKYGEAVQAIEAGMQRQPDYPRSPFQPRLDLYKGREEEFAKHLQLLEQTLAQNPQNVVYLFLYAHQLWFDGRRMEAVEVFRRARERSANPQFIDSFLRAAVPGPLAAN